MGNPYPINLFLKYLVKIWMTIFTWYYRISANVSDELKEFDQPYLLLSNHYGRYDPFIISHFIKKRPNFISSDAILRDRIIGTLFKGLGAMPKKKGVRDSFIIREMVKVARNGGSLSLFPEGTRTWSGETLFIDPSIAKLVKLLQIPLITAKMKGAYCFDPRWAKSIRRAKMEIDYNLVIAKEDIARLSEDEIMEILTQNLYQDDVEYQRSEKIEILSNKRAEHLDLVLFQCPICESYDGFESSVNSFVCKACGLDVHVDKYGFFSTKTNKKLPFDNSKDWLDWQNKNFVSYVREQILKENPAPLFKAGGFKIEYAIGDGHMISQGIGSILFYNDSLVIQYDDSEEKLMHADVFSLGPQFNERIELFYKDRAYRFTAKNNREPGIKWELASNVVWAKLDQPHKLSPYFRDLIVSAN